MTDLIRKKRDGGRLTDAEWRWLVAGASEGSIPDEQMAAFLMAAFLNGLDDAETLALTLAMRDSGETFGIPGLDRPLVDKHSTGGVGDKVTLVLGPVLAAMGLAMAKLSGRGLGYTGGTLDKLAAIPGFRTELTARELRDQVRRTGLAVTSPTADIAPADRRLYALRDATATVEEPGLIAASIMAKKLAVASDALVVDVKVGEGAFFPDGRTARAFATRVLAIGKGAGRRVSAVLTCMDRPLGQEVGNAREVAEAMAVLKGEGPDDVRQVVLALADELSSLLGRAGDSGAKEALASGRAWEAFEVWVKAQGGDLQALASFPPAGAATGVVTAPDRGRVQAVSALAVGRAAWLAGAGRAKKADDVDPAAGVTVLVREGDEVVPGDAVLVIHASDATRLEAATEVAKSAVRLGDGPVAGRDAVLHVIRQDGGRESGRT